MHSYMNAGNPYLQQGVPLPYELDHYPRRGFSHDTYNQLVGRPPPRLGQETPDCGKVIFNTGRIGFGRIIPKAKKKRRFSRPSRQRGSVDSSDGERCKSGGRNEPSGEIRRPPTNRQREPETETSSPIGQPRILELEFDEDEIYSFFKDVRRYEIDLIKDEANHYVPPSENGRSSSSLRRDLEKEEEWMEEEEEDSCQGEFSLVSSSQLTEKIENFLEYYKLICGKRKLLRTPLVKELIIRQMYNKTYLLSLFNGADPPPDEASESLHAAYRMNDSDECRFSDEGNSSASAISSRRSASNFLRENEACHYFSDDECLPRTESVSDEEEVPSRRGPRAPGEGGAAGCGFTADSPVFARSSSCAVLRRANHCGSGSANASVNTAVPVTDHAHECNADCDMPCKASGIPVYQGRPGQVNGGGGRKSPAPPPALPIRIRTLSQNSGKVISEVDRPDSAGKGSVKPLRNSNASKSPTPISKKAPARIICSKPPASPVPTLKKYGRCVPPGNIGLRENGAEENGKQNDGYIKRKSEVAKPLDSGKVGALEGGSPPHRNAKSQERKNYCSNSSLFPHSSRDEFQSGKELRTSLSSSETKINVAKISGAAAPPSSSAGNRRVSSLERNRGSIVSRIMGGDTLERSNSNNYKTSPFLKEKQETPDAEENGQRKGHPANPLQNGGSSEPLSSRNSSPTSSEGGVDSIRRNKKSKPIQNKRPPTNNKRNEMNNNVNNVNNSNITTSNKINNSPAKLNNINNAVNKIRKENSYGVKASRVASCTVTPVSAPVPKSARIGGAPGPRGGGGANMGVKRQKEWEVKSLGPSEVTRNGRQKKCASSDDLLTTTEEKDQQKQQQQTTGSKAISTSVNVLVEKNNNFDTKKGFQVGGRGSESSPSTVVANDSMAQRRCNNESEKESNSRLCNVQREPDSGTCNDDSSNEGGKVARCRRREARSPEMQDYSARDVIRSTSEESKEKRRREKEENLEKKNLKNSQQDFSGKNDSNSLPKDFDKAKLSQIIDVTLLENLKLNGEILGDQFDAIITTLKKVAESMDCIAEGDQEFRALPRGFFEKHNGSRINNQLNTNHRSNPKMNRSFSAPNNAVNDDISAGQNVARPFSFYEFVHPRMENAAHENKLNNGRKTEISQGFSSLRRINNRVDNTRGLMSRLTKSRELLHHLENEYKLLKGEEDFNDASNDRSMSSLQYEAKCLAKKFNDILEPFQTMGFKSPCPSPSPTRLSNPEGELSNPDCLANNSRPELNPFPSKDNRRKSSGPAPHEVDPSAQNEVKPSVIFVPQRATYKDLTLSHMGIPQNSAPSHNEIPQYIMLSHKGVPQCSDLSPNSLHQTAIHGDYTKNLVGQESMNYHGNYHCVMEEANYTSYLEEGVTYSTMDANGMVVHGQEDPNHHRSLSLPKSFLSDKYGLNGIRSAITSVAFPWRRDHLDSNGTPEGSSRGEESHRFQEDAEGEQECFSEHHPSKELFGQFSSEGPPSVREEGDGEEEKPRRNSSFSRSSISHSEWDIRRPWSTPDADGSILSQSVCRLAVGAEERVNTQPQARSDEAFSPIAYQTNSTSISYQNSHEGMFQKFKKSLSLRLNKKTSRSGSPGVEKSLCSLPMEVQSTSDVFQTSLTSSPRCQVKEDESKSNYFKFGHPIFRSSKERRRAKLKDVRSSKCNSGDSGDSGIEVISGTSTLVSGEVSPSLAFREDSSPPIISYNSGHNGLEEEVHDVTANDRVVRRTQSDLFTKPPHKHLSCSDFSYRQQSLGRQYSSPQPIKLRPHHRLPNYNSVTTVQRNQRLKRSRASTHLRRSVSQPLDLDKSFQAQVSLHKMRTSDDDPPTERLRRPSVDNLLSDEITSEEEAGMSDCDESKPEFKFYLDEEEEMIVYAEALWDHVSLDSDELVFKAGDLITVVDSSDKDWWWGRIPPRAGWFPASFVRLLVNQEDHQNKSDHTDDPGIWNDRQLSISSLSQDEIRSNVINEILSTERDYVKHLKDVVEGYLKQVRKRPDMFCEESISTIFGNMEALFCFHTHFLAQLEVCIDFEEPHLSCIGDCFIRNKNRFEIYSEYCNNHPLAVSELQQLYQYQKYVHFFEACRLLQEMIDISLDGFLLTPVQKICKYPLQLQELLKYTQPSHRDFTSVHGAMQAMKEVALLVNERRRRMECLEKIATWQKSVEGWEGLDLLEDSSQLIHQGEVIKGVGTSWPKEVALFLFDHQLVYCKKDLLKRNTFVYRGRINTDLCEVFSIPFDPTRSAALQNTWKIHCLHKNKTYVFSCKTPAEKQKWLTAFKRERELVAIDETSGFVASEKQKQVARLAARNQKSKPKKPKMKSHKRTQAMTYAQAHLLVNDGEIRSNSLPLRGSQEAKKKGLWFSFGGHKKSRGSNRNAKHNSLQND